MVTLKLELELYDLKELLSDAQKWAKDNHYDYDNDDAYLVADYMLRSAGGEFAHSEEPEINKY